MKKIQVLLLLCVICAAPAAGISRWFSATFNDLKFTLYRYGHCVNGLQPVTSARFNETEYLINQVRTFLDQGNYDHEQLANVSSLMDTICRTSAEPSYPISVHVDIGRFNSSTNPAAKNVRCKAIDDAMDSMYWVFRRAALNRSEPLDFGSILFYPNASDKTATYNLSDLINTSWITSEVVLEHVCNITNSTKEYISNRTSHSSLQERFDHASSYLEFLNRLLDPLFGFQKRLYWESSNRFEFLQNRISSGVSTIRGSIGNGFERSRSVLFGARQQTAAPASANATHSNLTWPQAAWSHSQSSGNASGWTRPRNVTDHIVTSLSSLLNATSLSRGPKGSPDSLPTRALNSTLNSGARVLNTTESQASNLGLPHPSAGPTMAPFNTRVGGSSASTGSTTTAV